MLNKQAAERLLSVNLKGEELIQMFNTLANLLANQPAEQVAWTLSYVSDTELQVGELVPTINFVLTRHNPQELQEKE